MADSIYTLDPVAGNNTSLDTIPYGPNQLYHNQIDNLFRAINAKTAQFVDDLGAVNTIGGTGDAVTVTLASGITAYATGQIFRFIAGAANTGAATMNVNSLGAKAIRKISGGTDVALSANDILAGETYLVRYSATANSSAGAWILVGGASTPAATTTNVLTGTSTSVYTTPDSIAALWEKGSDEASAGTVSFGEGGFFHITGTTTITDLDFDVATDGRAVDVVFDGALTLTHNGTTLKLPGGANITTAAGDRARFVQDSSDNVICLWYVRAGAPPSLGPHVILEDQKAQNTAGGTFTTGADQTRTLNTEVYDPYGYCALSSNQFTLGAGTWSVSWSAPAFNVGRHQSWLYNVTDASVVGRATSDNVGASSQSLSVGGAVFTITGSKAFEIRHRCQITGSSNGFGVEGNFGTEIYTRVEITKVA